MISTLWNLGLALWFCIGIGWFLQILLGCLEIMCILQFWDAMSMYVSFLLLSFLNLSYTFWIFWSAFWISFWENCVEISNIIHWKTFPTEWPWYSCWKSFDYICMGFISGLFYSILLEYMPILMSLPYCFDYCSFVGSFKIRNYKSFDFLKILLFSLFRIPSNSI